ncbi:cation-chloride cotransporter 1 [Selaginella moellendorffii]|uniref:cation-chloride cotransporter 1 n=1 Tax=Selaginella moellendorffii TaxID=88036 RepID=UPI000D1CFBD4|nr:cation-chloride cotransporter 1 [Selaginella moellendorffii]|eukprot:XP_024535740.1 cation-chloride cotransporter 1 [Selaginella moellendorffii]
MGVEKGGGDADDANAAGRRESPRANGELDVVDLEVPAGIKSVNTGRSSQNARFDQDDGPVSPTDEIFDQTERETKLELFEIDSLVDVVGLKSMGGQQPPQAFSPRAGEEIAITLGRPRPRGAKLGTLMGVFVPCLQNILGIIFYIRFSWIVGLAGIGQSLVLVSLCCLCTFLTGISLSAIATNGAMKGGGPYYLIGRALGPEVGISIGLCFFLGNAVAGSLYILGAVETFLDALPGAGIFQESVTQLAPAPAGSSPEILKSPSLHDLQVYGVIVTIILCLIVFGGVKIINRVAPAFLIPVLLSVFLIFIGIFAAPRRGDPSGVTGLRWRTLHANWGPEYQRTNRAGIPAPDGIIYWNFEDLLGLFFPAVTGIMAGSNRSASLRDTQRSIPVGTLLAIASTTCLYLISAIMFGSVANREELLTNRLLTATLAWPVPAVVQVGIILSTLGAALQSLTGAPRLLAAIANDDILPVLKYFKAPDGVEPHLATLFTMFICSSCVIIGDLDLISPVITMFFLLCYAGVNLSCLLLDLLDAPSWRPRWKFHHWSFSLLGALLCIVIMFLISWIFTTVSLALASLIYYYVSLKGKAGDWGDGFKSAYFQLALRSLRSLGANNVHPKNWYPIPLIFCKPWGILPQDVPCHPKLADFANCMKKKGRGMSIFVSISEGEYIDKVDEARQACRLLGTYIDYKNCEGVAEVIIAKDVCEGFRGIVQTMGLGNLKPNIVCMRYPEIWRDEQHGRVSDVFVSIINDCSIANKAVVIVKGLDEWPGEYQKQYGTIDLYWIVRDGGLMLLLSQLLRAKDSFESCKIQVFCISEEDTEAEELKADVKKFLYDLRMQAEVIVVTMKSWEAHQEDRGVDTGREDAMEAFSKARKRIAHRSAELKKKAASIEDEVQHSYNEQQVNKFLYTSLKLNSIIMRYSRMAAVVLVSLPPPPPKHPSYCYMEYMDLLVDGIPRLLMVRGYRRDVITIFT